MIILGAGMAGLLAANVLRKQRPKIIEAQQSLPNNHAALLRFRDRSIADATTIPFREVIVQKEVEYRGSTYKSCPLKLANMYARKVVGTHTSRSILNLDPVRRYIAPNNFIQLLANDVDIEFGVTVTRHMFAEATDGGHPVISTIPMPAMFELLKEQDETSPPFGFREITVATLDYVANCDLYQTIYFPDPDLSLYRASVTGNRFIFEFVGPRDNSRTTKDDLVCLANEVFGIDEKSLLSTAMSVKSQRYGKINEIDDKWRKDFIIRTTNTYGVYSLGRYATWRNLLMDDVYRDILVIDKLMKLGKYERGLASV